MPRKIDGIQYYTKAEIDQFILAGYGASLGNRNALAVSILQANWTQETTPGHPFVNGYYADAVHGRTTSPFAMIVAFTGANNVIHVCDGTNEYQVQQSSSAVRIWLSEEPQYDLFCLVVYA